MEVDEGSVVELQSAGATSAAGSPASSRSSGADRQKSATTTTKGKANATKTVIDLDSGDENNENRDPKDASKTSKEAQKSKTDKGKGKEAPKKRKSETKASKAKDDGDSSDDAVQVTSKPAKKPKLDKEKAKASTSSSAVKPSSSAVSAGDGLVSIKNNKLVVKQKKLDLANRNEFLQKRMAWNEFLEDVTEPLEEIPEDHLPLLALLVQESEKTIGELAKFLKTNLAPAASGDEDSQQTVDLVPTAILTKAIKTIASRTNFGYRDNPTVDNDEEEDLDERDLPQGFDTVPNHLRVWRWEVEDKKAMFDCLPEDVLEKIHARVKERRTIRDLTKRLIAGLSEEDQASVLSKGGKAGDAKDKEAGSSKPKAAGEGKKKADSGAEDGAESSAPKKKKKKELTAEEQAEEAEKKRVKEEEKAERLRKKEEKDAVNKEKAAAKAKVEQALKKSSNMFGNWLAKAGTSPPLGSDSGTFPASTPMKERSTSSGSGKESSAAPMSAAQPSLTKPKRAGEEYHVKFKPFNLKQGFEVAPTNRFLKRKEIVKLDADDMDEDEPVSLYAIDSRPDMTVAESMQDFLSCADKKRLPAKPSSARVTHNVSDLMAAINEAELCGNTTESNRLRAILRNPSKVPMKLFKFKEDVRPAYFGTWTKSSKAISARRPLARDETLLSYDYDSEAEWEEDPDDAENIESEVEAEDESEDDLDGWLAGDDEQIEMEEGYEDMSMQVDPDDPFQVEMAKNKRMTMKTAPKKRKVTGPLIAVIKGPYFEDEASDDESTKDLQKYFETFKIQLIGSDNTGRLDPFAKVEKKARPSLKAAQSGTDGLPAAGSGAVNKLEVKKGIDPALLSLVTKHIMASLLGNKLKVSEEVATALAAENKKVSKAQILKLVESNFTKKKGKKEGEPVWELNEAQKEAASA